MKYYQGVDYFLFFMDFPHMGVPGVIASNSDGTANIYIKHCTVSKFRVERSSTSYGIWSKTTFILTGCL